MPYSHSKMAFDVSRCQGGLYIQMHRTVASRAKLELAAPETRGLRQFRNFSILRHRPALGGSKACSVHVFRFKLLKAGPCSVKSAQLDYRSRGARWIYNPTASRRGSCPHERGDSSCVSGMQSVAADHMAPRSQDLPWRRLLLKCPAVV